MKTNNIQRAVELARKGGFSVENIRVNGEILYPNPVSSRPTMSIADLIIQPDFWRAIGKTQGWFLGEICDGHGVCVPDNEWEGKMIKFVRLLIEGKDIDTALGEILTHTK